MRRSSAPSSPGIGEDFGPWASLFLPASTPGADETLIETRRTSSSRRESATGRFRAGTARPSGSAPGSLVSRRGIRAVLVGSGLAGLLGVTACAVASVSAWLVPVYLLLVTVILTAPRGSRASSPAAGSRAGFLGTRIAEHGQSAGEGRADGTGPAEPGPDARQDPDLAAGESDDAESSHLRLDPAAAAIARPRRSKARTRKAARPAAELAPEFAPVTWVRVGPGKYVRSDAIIQGQPPAEAPAPAEAVASDADPATDPPEPATAAPTDVDPATPAVDADDAAALTSEEPATTAFRRRMQETAIPPTLESEAPEGHPTSEAPEPAPTVPEFTADASPTAEEHGIAPSAFGPPCPLPVVNGPLYASGWRERSPNRRRYLGPRAMSHGRRTADRRTTDRAGSFRGRFRRSHPRTTDHGRRTTDTREGAARRAFGRTEHVRRDWRARSPPGRTG